MTARALTTLAGERDELEEEEEQLGLFAEPETEPGQALAKKKHAGPGRPPGARNKRTERSIAYLMARHRDPREVLLEIAEANPFDLAARFQMTVAEALTEKRLCAIGVLPYLAARVTPEVVDNRGAIYLTINTGEAMLSAEASEGAVVLQPGEYETVPASERPSADDPDQSKA